MMETTLTAVPDKNLDPTAVSRTMMFTDIEGSTVLLEHLRDDYARVLMRHHEILRTAISQSGGTEVSTTGDAFFAIFGDATSALQAAIKAQTLLQAERWHDGVTVRVRIGIHTGPTRFVNGQYVGIDVHRAARICSCGHGGQIVVSRDTVDVLEAAGIPAFIELRKLGRHRLKDLRYPETLFDVLVPGLKQDFKPVRSLNNLPTNLANNEQELFGREAEVAELKRKLTHPSQRLITLTGTGGVGKSSLARKVGEEALDDFPDGVYLFELSGISEPALVLPAVAQTIGVRDYPGRPVLLDIAAAVGAERQLFILDTFEHLLEARSDVGKLVDACPNLRVLVTSRSALNLRMETTLDLAPLPVPPKNSSIGQLLQNPSAELFVRRVQELVPDFVVNAQSAGTIAQICRRLEGIPLAIELASARVRLLGLDGLLNRLTAVLDLLKGGGGVSEERHRTLRAAIEWSDNLLSPEERTAFRLTSVFSGGFRFADAEAMLSGMVDPDIDMLTAIGSLVDNSLILPTSVNGEPRLKMLDMVREYASAAYAAEGDVSALRDRHLAFFADVAEQCASMCLNAGQRPFVARLEAETDNIRSALAWALERRDVTSVSRIVYALHWYWISQAQFTEAQTWMDRAVALADASGETSAAVARIHEAACSLKMGSGDYLAGEPHGEKALAHFQSVGDATGATRASLTHCICATVAGKIEDPSEILMAAIETFRGTDDYHAALGLILLGEGARMSGATDAAEACYTDAMELLAAGGNVYWPGHLKQNIAHFRLKAGDWQGAAQLLSEAFDLAEDYDFPLVSNLCVAGFGGVAIARGDKEMAARILGAVEHNLEKIGVVFEPTDRADVDRYIAATRAALGDEGYMILASEGAAMPWDDLRSMARAQAGDQTAGKGHP